MKPFPLNVTKFRYPDGRRLCQGCLDAVAELAAATGAAVHAHGRVDLDAGDPRTKALWRRIVSCRETAAGAALPAPKRRAPAPAPAMTPEQLAARLAVRQATCEACPSMDAWKDPGRTVVYCDEVPATTCAQHCRSLEGGRCPRWAAAAAGGGE